MVRVLSIRQPWAWLIVHGPKRIENRTWRTAYRGRFFIHVGLRVDEAARVRFASQIPSDLPVGGVVGSAELVDVVEASDDPWFFGPVGLVLDHVRALPFIPCPGRLSLYRPDVGLAERLQAAEAARS